MEQMNVFAVNMHGLEGEKAQVVRAAIKMWVGAPNAAAGGDSNLSEIDRALLEFLTSVGVLPEGQHVFMLATNHRGAFFLFRDGGYVFFDVEDAAYAHIPQDIMFKDVESKEVLAKMAAAANGDPTNLQ